MKDIQQSLMGLLGVVTQDFKTLVVNVKKMKANQDHLHQAVEKRYRDKVKQ